MAVFIPAYLSVRRLMQSWGKGNRAVQQQHIDFFEALPEDAKARLERGEYPPYHHVRAAARVTSVSVDTAKYWLQAFLYWRSKSSALSAPSTQDTSRTPKPD